VVYDDVNYIKGGWINRNRVLVNGLPKYFTLPLDKASPYKKINEIQIKGTGRSHILNVIENAYKRAPYFEESFPMIKRILENPESNLANYLYKHVLDIVDILGIKTEILLSSRDVGKNIELKGQDKVLDICRNTGATVYINAIGGQKLYCREVFDKKGIDLFFIKMHDIQYKQWGDEFVSNLSIVDLLMFNSKEKVKEMLNEYDLC
jgi:hypothetical protein